ncbi:MAG: phosphatase PAP2 family protein [Alphaproteobacteria bacterium]|nr:phosphatase PAP2 family protein [Alphaproteobacteria bacterium]
MRFKRYRVGIGAAALGLALAAATGAALALAPEGPASPPSPAMSPTAAKVALGTGYLAGHEPDTVLVTPQAPAVGSPRDVADLAIFRQTRTLKDTPRWRLAISDAVLKPDAILADFSCAAGVALTPQNAPALITLMRRMAPDIASAYGQPKTLYKRPRPFTRAAGEICVPRDPDLASSPDYPSGHATFSWTYGMVLAELMPDRAAQIMARARSFGESRVVCGVHTASAITEAWAPASTLFAVLQANPAFRSDLEAARREIEAVRASGPGIEGSGACLAQAALIAKTPW